MQPSNAAALPRAPRSSFLRPNSLLTRLLLALFLLMAVASTCQIFATIYIWNSFNRSSLVELYRSVANEIARQIEIELKPDASETEVTRLLYRIAATCPDLDPFLLDTDGKVIASLQGRASRLSSLSPLERFLQQRGEDRSLIWGEHPLTKQPSLFSAAQVSLPTGAGYVYVLLGSDAATVLRQSIGDSSVASISILFALLSLLTTTLLGYLVFRQIFRRYRENALTMQQFELGNYSVRLDDRGTSEVASHARAFNRMADKIAETISQLELVDASRRALIAAVTHDLRRPLTNIHLAVQRIEMRATRANDTSTASLALEAKYGCDTLDQLIEDLFELAKLDAGEKLQFAPLRVESLYTHLTSTLGHTAEQHNISLLADFPPALEVQGDEDKLKRLLANLVENAILYAGDGSKVTLHATLEDGKVLMSVRDTGRGIPEHECTRLFEWFYRGAAGVAERPSGSGLGLAICKRIAELHGSELKLQSEEGKGTAFSFFLPEAARRS